MKNVYSDAVVGNVLIIWSRLHLIDVSLLIFYIGDLSIDKSYFSYYYSGACLSCRSDICFIACLTQGWVHMCLQLLCSVADLSFNHCTVAFFVFRSPVCEVT